MMYISFNFIILLCRSEFECNALDLIYLLNVTEQEKHSNGAKMVHMQTRDNSVQ